MSETVLFIIDDGNVAKKTEMLQAQVLPENVTANVAIVPYGVNRAVYYNAAVHEAKANYTIYLYGDFDIYDCNMTMMLIEVLRKNKDAALVGLHGTNKFSVDLCQWQNDFANFPVGAYTAKFINSTVLATSSYIPWKEDNGLDDGLLYIGYAIDVQRQKKKLLFWLMRQNICQMKHFHA